MPSQLGLLIKSKYDIRKKLKKKTQWKLFYSYGIDDR